MKKKYIIAVISIIVIGIIIYGVHNIFIIGGEIIRVEANPQKGFQYEYYLYIPYGADKSETKYMLVEPNNTGETSDNHYVHEIEVKIQLELMGSGVSNKIAKQLKIPLLMPVFDRPKSNWKMYTHALDRDTLKNKEGKLARIDLQLINMIKDAQEKLRNKEIMVKDKVFMYGFSASGSFVNRFTALHPNIVKAVASGGLNCMPIIPSEGLEGEKLMYPIGVYDTYQIANIKFDIEQYRGLEQYIYMGELDDNDTLPFGDAFDDEEKDLIRKFLGIHMKDRWEKARKIYKALNIPAQLIMYNGVGHSTKPEMRNDIIRFFQKNSK